jgi:hypothetical protein
MKSLQKIISHPNFWPLAIVLFVGLLASHSLIGPGYFNMHDDLQMMRQLEMEKCFKDLQIPCRWVPDMGYGYGFPLFNYYPPLPYLVGQIIRLFGFPFVDTIKILFIIAFLASGITMYFLSREFFGKTGGILSSVFYIWAPYHSVDVFVRGAMNESWALIFFPAILLLSYKLLTTPPKPRTILDCIIALSLSWVGLLLSHNLMVMIFTPIFAVWCLLFLFKFKAWNKIPFLLISAIFASGLAAFFTLPVLLEQNLVHTETLVSGYFGFVGHFKDAGQILFSRFWDYGPSAWLHKDDKMSFQIGHIHWILSLVIFVLALFNLIENRRKSTATSYTIYAILFLFASGWFAAFMIHSKSTPIWLAIPPLRYLQFPWRFLTLVILNFSLIIGSLVLFIPRKFVKILIITLSFAVIAFNWNYFLPQHGKLGPLTDDEKFSGIAWDLQRTAGIYDYLPKTAVENPRDGKITIADVIKGSTAEIFDAKEGTNWVNFRIDVFNGEAQVRINTYLFPNWKVFIDGKETSVFIPDEEKWGRMYINIPQGEHTISAKLYNTPIRIAGNIISLICWILLLVIIFKKMINLKWKPSAIFKGNNSNY